MTAYENKVFIIYDGDCPVCKNLIVGSRLKDAGIKLILINARNENVCDIDWFPSHVNINSDLVLKIKEKIFYGGEAIHALSFITTKSTLLNRMVFSLFSYKFMAKLMYPILRVCRVILLKIYRIDQLKSEK